MSKKPTKPPETFTGGFSRIPHAVMDSQAFIGLSDRGKSLLFALIRQINGSNNGRLQLTNKWLSGHGWQSHSSNSKAIAELIERELIVISRLGGLNSGSNWYAVTWLQISNFVGLDITAQSYKQGSWADCKLPQTVRRKPPQKQKTIPISGTALSPLPGQRANSLSRCTGRRRLILTNPLSRCTGTMYLYHIYHLIQVVRE